MVVVTLDELAVHMRSLTGAEQGLRWARRLFSTGCALFYLAFSTLFFLMQYSPVGQIVLFIGSLLTLVISVPLIPVAWLARRRLWRQRNRLHGVLFAQGLRVDEAGRVVTNDPHPRLIYDHARLPGAV